MTISDSSSLTNDGSGNPNYHAAGKFGHAISFDGIDTNRSVHSSGINSSSNAISISTWVYPQSVDFHLFAVEGSLPCFHWSS